MINEPVSTRRGAGEPCLVFSPAVFHCWDVCLSLRRIPSGTSPELTALLQGLLRRNAKDRMEFDDFFNHQFIRKSHPPPSTPPLPVPTLARLSTPPKSPPRPVPSSNAVTHHNNAPTPEEADDFVLVPSPSQLPGSREAAVGGDHQNDGDTQPLPVPSQRDAYLKVCSNSRP